MRIGASAFAQANTTVADALVRDACEALGQVVERAETVVELFAGAGTFTFALAEVFGRVTAVEQPGIFASIGDKKNWANRHQQQTAATNCLSIPGCRTLEILHHHQAQHQRMLPLLSDNKASLLHIFARPRIR